MQGQLVPASYDPDTATLVLGPQGGFGQGLVANNYGVLVRDADAGDATVVGCTWHQCDDVTIIVTGTYTFTASVVEQRTNIAPACGAPAASCASSWTWVMWADGSSTGNGCQEYRLPRAEGRKARRSAVEGRWGEGRAARAALTPATARVSLATWLATAKGGSRRNLAMAPVRAAVRLARGLNRTPACAFHAALSWL